MLAAQLKCWPTPDPLGKAVRKQFDEEIQRNLHFSSLSNNLALAEKARTACLRGG